MEPVSDQQMEYACSWENKIPEIGTFAATQIPKILADSKRYKSLNVSE